MLSIKGLDKARVFKALFNSSHPQGMGFLQPNCMENISYEYAKEIINRQTDFDYFNGRIMKVNLDGDEFDEYLYDRDNGKDAAKEAIKNEFGDEWVR